MEGMEKVLAALKRLEEGLLENSNLMGIVENLIGDAVQNRDPEILDKTVKKILKISNFSNLLIAIYHANKDYNEMKTSINIDVLNWIYSLSVRYGLRMYSIRLFVDSPLSWRSVESKMFYDNGPKAQLTFNRNDTNSLVIECNKVSLIGLISVLVDYLDDMVYEDLTEKESTELSEVIDNLKKIHSFDEDNQEED
ncbi:hypothetical protein ACX1C1_05205 [Paenibacillus sp. strain BS8-2]